MAEAVVRDTAPLISVCIANYNGMKVIADCLVSVIEQLGDIPVEILIHDDASSDGSLAYIRESFPSVVLIESTKNVGFCIANNRMAALATGKYLLLLNNDAALYPDALQTLLFEAKRLDVPSILSLPQYDAANGSLIDRGCLLDPFLNPVPNLDPNLDDVAMVIGAGLWLPKSLWEELGGFPEWFGSIAEDMYICCRARLAGYQVRVLRDSGYWHSVGSSFGGGKAVSGQLVTTYKRRALSERNKIFVMIIYYPSPILLWFLPLHLILIHLEGVLLTAIKMDKNIWRKIYAPILPALWSHHQILLSLRRVVQSSRKTSWQVLLRPFCWIPWKLRMLIRHGLPNLS